ncbi:DNA polymerase III subunit [Constantimarinum furrinae]|nr:DNA polymerase III subunit delta' [Constantimarinum furrinae]
MDFSDIIGQQHIKSHLLKTIENGRIPHAQLFVGNNGSGILASALAYAKSLLCQQHASGSPEHQLCAHKVDRIAHPDLHFVYPVTTNDTVKKHAVSDSFSEEWRSFILKKPYGSLFDWFQTLGIENKQGNISVREAEEIARKLTLKSYEGGYKVLIIWMAEKMNTECSNKILKVLEEPPEKTVLLLLTEDEEQILTTITSRCQKLRFPLLPEDEISKTLINKQLTTENKARKVAKQAAGDYNKALHILNEDGDDLLFEKWFVSWVRTAFKAKGNKSAINELLRWSDSLAGEGRETQKKFLGYCMEMFRQGLLRNYGTDTSMHFETESGQFSLDKFAPFVHQNNIYDIISALEDASYHIERNGNAKIIFTDLSIQLTRLIHRKELV